MENMKAGTADQSIVEIVHRYGGMVAEWNDLKAAHEHDQAKAQNMVAQVKPPPALGQHTVEILRELELGDSEIGALMTEGVV
jgi:crotonobetainyl-CoA:carnitine CoA-transferase CaiB-like acyl-CoA transferase